MDAACFGRIHVRYEHGRSTFMSTSTTCIFFLSETPLPAISPLGFRPTLSNPRPFATPRAVSRFDFASPIAITGLSFVYATFKLRLFLLFDFASSFSASTACRCFCTCQYFDFALRPRVLPPRFCLIIQLRFQSYFAARSDDPQSSLAVRQSLLWSARNSAIRPL